MDKEDDSGISRLFIAFLSKSLKIPKLQNMANSISENLLPRPYLDVMKLIGAAQILYHSIQVYNIFISLLIC